MSTTKDQILADIKAAMKAGDKSRLATLRLISAAIKQKEVDERIDVDESQTMAILDKLMKQRREKRQAATISLPSSKPNQPSFRPTCPQHWIRAKSTR